MAKVETKIHVTLVMLELIGVESMFDIPAIKLIATVTAFFFGCKVDGVKCRLAFCHTIFPGSKPVAKLIRKSKSVCIVVVVVLIWVLLF